MMTDLHKIQKGFLSHLNHSALANAKLLQQSQSASNLHGNHRPLNKRHNFKTKSPSPNTTTAAIADDKENTSVLR